jgi:hypothetical protein
MRRVVPPGTQMQVRVIWPQELEGHTAQVHPGWDGDV